MILLFTTALVSACEVVECVDAQFEREPIPLKDEAHFALAFPDGERQSYTVKCEKYYDAMCAERGNS
ncbi:hypothetical protein GCM10011338_02170 [Alteromonas lipolytica]|nr:hypothetical protein GCM10011338_02170 [Alteromonas lipolytica]